MSRADACCLNVETNEFGDQFAEISRNLEAMNRSMKDFNKSSSNVKSAVGAKRGSQHVVGDWLLKNRQSLSQVGQRNVNRRINTTSQPHNLLSSERTADNLLFDH